MTDRKARANMESFISTNVKRKGRGVVAVASLLAAGASVLAVMPVHASSPFPLAKAQLQGVTVSVSYADTARPNPKMPVPWIGDPGIQYSPGENVGPYDAGAIRLDNTTGHRVRANVLVTLPNHAHGDQTLDLWGNITINAKGSYILTQTEVHRGPQYYESNFDTSDFEPQPANCNAPVAQGDAPQVTLTLFNPRGKPTVTATFVDSGRILDTGGYDSVKCGNEALGWSLIGSVQHGRAQEWVGLSSSVSSGVVKQTQAVLTATVLDASEHPLQNATVTFVVLSGPDKGSLGSAVTDGSGHATKTYTGQAKGTDVIRAIVPNASGGNFVSSKVIVHWKKS